MRHSMMDTRVIMAGAVMVLGISAMMSFVLGEAEWFGRAGSIVTVLGLILMVKQNLLCAATDIDTAIIEKPHHNTPAPRRGTALYASELARARRILRNEMLGFCTLMVGTVTWGYGDLLIGLAL